MAGLFGFATKSPQNNNIADDLRILKQEPTTLFSWVQKAKKTETQNDFVFSQGDTKNEIMYDRKRFSLPTRQRQYLYDTKPWKVGLDEDHVHYPHSQLNIGDKEAFSTSKVHRPYQNLKNIIMTSKSFYV